MTAITKKPENPIAHLTPEDIEQIGIELDAIRQDIIDERGEADAAYIRRVISVQRRLELGSRAVLLASVFPPAWVVGTAGLSVAKILENMEIGHNVLHGQWDWMRDPKRVRPQAERPGGVRPGDAGPGGPARQPGREGGRR